MSKPNFLKKAFVPAVIAASLAVGSSTSPSHTEVPSKPSDPTSVFLASRVTDKKTCSLRHGPEEYKAACFGPSAP